MTEDSPHQISRALTRMTKSRQDLTALERKLHPIFKGQSLLIASMLKPHWAWNVYFGMGARGVSSKVLLGALGNLAVPAVIVYLSLTLLNMPDKIQSLAEQRGALWSQSFWIIQIAGTGILALVVVAYLPVFLGLWIGTILLALGRSPIKEFTNVQGVHLDNFITRWRRHPK